MSKKLIHLIAIFNVKRYDVGVFEIYKAGVWISRIKVGVVERILIIMTDLKNKYVCTLQTIDLSTKGNVKSEIQLYSYLKRNTQYWHYFLILK